MIKIKSKNMNAQKKIDQLKNEIKQLEETQRSCRHDFADPIYDPEEVSVQDDHAGYEVHGVDRWPVLSFHKEYKNRWSRECKNCGHKEYTYKNTPVIKEYKPDFS